MVGRGSRGHERIGSTGAHVAEEQDAIRARSTDRALVRERLMATGVPAKRARRGAPALGRSRPRSSSRSGRWGSSGRAPHEALTATFGRANEPAAVGTWLEAAEIDPLPFVSRKGRDRHAPRSRARIRSPSRAVPGARHLSSRRYPPGPRRRHRVPTTAPRAGIPDRPEFSSHGKQVAIAGEQRTPRPGARSFSHSPRPRRRVGFGHIQSSCRRRADPLLPPRG